MVVWGYPVGNGVSFGQQDIARYFVNHRFLSLWVNLHLGNRTIGNTKPPGVVLRSDQRNQQCAATRQGSDDSALSTTAMGAE